MHVVCERKELVAALRNVLAVVNSRIGPPSLRNVKLTAGESHKLALAASDNDVGIRRAVHAAAVVQPGTACVSASRLKLIVDQLSERYVVLEAGDESLTIRSKQVEFTVPLEDVDEFPELAEFEATSYYVVQARDLKALIRRTNFAVDIESTRYALGGTLVELTAESIALVATDGRRLARMARPANTVNEPVVLGGQSVIPVKALTLIDDNLSDGDGLVSVSLAEDGLCVHVEGIATIHSRLLEGRFPDYESVFLQNIQGSAQLDAGSLLAAVRQGAVVLDEGNAGIQLHFEAGSLRLVGQSDDGAGCRAELAVSHEGQPVSVTLHPRYLIEPLRLLRSQTRVIVEWFDANNPLVLRAPDGFVNLIMPMCIDA
jgi:DNA polymerase III subunit beta